MAGSLDSEMLQTALRRAAAGDEVAWRTIVDAYSRRVFGLVRAHCGNADLAEEITQSTFCTIVSKIGSYTEQGKFESWLFRIAMNRLRDEMRRRKRQATPVEDETLAGLVAPGEPLPTPGAEGYEVEELTRAMARLPDADRRILHLRYCAGLSFKQIADVLEQPLGTVLARQHRAVKKLRGLIADADADAGDADAGGEAEDGGATQ